MDLQVEECKQRGWIISIPDFWIDGKRAGWKDRKILSLVRQAVGEVESKEDAEKIVQELEKFMNNFQPKTSENIKDWHKGMKAVLDKYWSNQSSDSG